MIVKRFEAVNYRNIVHEVIEPCEGVNLIFGENAQGKTNMIEGIWLFTGCRSFRGAKDNELKRFGTDKTILSMDYFGQQRDQNLYLEISDARKFQKNSVKLKKSASVIGEFTAVVFSPVHLSLIQDGPSERRKFLDIAISQQKPYYADFLMQYNKTIIQRNMLLKDISARLQPLDLLDVWDERLAQLGAEVVCRRLEYIDFLEKGCEEIYYGLSSQKEKLSISYQSFTKENIREKSQLKEILLQNLLQVRTNDMQYKSTSVGPHRDDLLIKINGLSARSYGSQGQQRSCALALKLGEAAVIKQLTGEQPVALLDDVMSELDTSRQDYILNHIRDWQVFITCCDPFSVKNLKYGKSFEIRNGSII